MLKSDAAATGAADRPEAPGLVAHDAAANRARCRARRGARRHAVAAEALGGGPAGWS